MAKLTKMQINRLEEQLNAKIAKLTSEEFFPAIDEDTFTKEKRENSAVKNKVIYEMINMLSNRYCFVTKKEVPFNFQTYIRHLNAVVMFEMVFTKNHDLSKEYKLADAKYNKLLDDHKTLCTDRENRIKNLRTGLEETKEEILNAAYFKDSQFALDALDTFGV